MRQFLYVSNSNNSSEECFGMPIFLLISKMLGGWIVTTEHLAVYAFEAPSFEAFQKLGNEPEVLALSAFETYEIKPAISFEEAVQMIQQAT